VVIHINRRRKTKGEHGVCMQAIWAHMTQPDNECQSDRN